jgi:heptosyltransferase-2
MAHKESIHHIPWSSTTPPMKILAIRLQAFGDVVITLPYLQALQSLLPKAQIHFLTRDEFSALPATMTIFRHVFTLRGDRNPRRQWLHAVALLPSLLREQYDVILDLQRNSLSRIIRKTLRPKAFCEFDRFSLQSAGERTRGAIQKLGIAHLPEVLPGLTLRDNDTGWNKLQASNFDPGKKLIILNPAGNFITKNWPLEYYARFARLWLETIDTQVQFLILGTESLQAKAEYLKNWLGKDLLSLVGATTQIEAFTILRHADLVLSEDSGLMHLACAARVPVIALFGSTTSVWARPWGPVSACLDSSDLECGECSQPICRFGDIRCLTRHTPESVLKTAQDILLRQKPTARVR